MTAGEIDDPRTVLHAEQLDFNRENNSEGQKTDRGVFHGEKEVVEGAAAAGKLYPRMDVLKEKKRKEESKATLMVAASAGNCDVNDANDDNNATL